MDLASMVSGVFGKAPTDDPTTRKVFVVLEIKQYEDTNECVEDFLRDRLTMGDPYLDGYTVESTRVYETAAELYQAEALPEALGG